MFNNNLKKGETVYFEIVGFNPENGKPIMASGSNKKLPKEIINRYGETMTFSYGCKPKECDLYVYRMTIANEDGVTVDYPWDALVKRCKELNVKTVPYIGRIFNQYDDLYSNLSDNLKSLSEGPSFLDDSHIREGICVRIEGSLTPQIFKYKSFTFKMLEDLIKELKALRFK